MEKQFLKRNVPNFILVEGFWNVGKSNFANYVRALNGFVKINEPDHILSNAKKEISSWYVRKHINRMKLAKKELLKNKKVVMERSIISSIAYKYALNKKILKKDYVYLMELARMTNIGAVVFLYGDERFICRRSRCVKDLETRKLFSQKGFYKRYLKFYKVIVPKYFKSVILIKVNNKKNRFKCKMEILNKFYSSFPLLDKKVVECASMVSFYKNKILLLYDHNYKHFVLPQGHKETNENLKETALRELREETGFDCLKVVKKIKKYQYHYVTNTMIVYKTISVFLVEILNKNYKPKKLEKHESYSNHFFSVSRASSVVRWPQDREAILSAVKIKKTTL